MNSERWVVVGGTFDPVHAGHLHLARSAVEHLGATVGVLAVGATHRHRPPAVLPWHQRVELVRAALADEPSLVEAGQVGVRYRNIVLVGRSLATPRRELHFVFGADSAARLARWSGGADLMRLGTVWAVERAGAGTWGALPAGIQRLAIPALDVSSTEVRARCAGGTPVAGLVPRSIEHHVLHAYGAERRRPLRRPA